MSREKKMKCIEWSLFAAFALCILFAMNQTAERAKPIRESVLRLHILADSDDPKAQQEKLQVRDAVLAATETIVPKGSDRNEAEQIITENLDRFTDTANQTLETLGVTYRATASVEDHYFPTRDYGGVSLPAGTYRSLVVRLGKAEGRNWWCVLFPPLCYNGENIEANNETKEVLKSTLPEEEYQIITEPNSEEVKVKFRCLELFGTAKHLFGLD